MSKISVTECKSYDASEVSAAFTRLLEPFGGLKMFEGLKTVVIKANLVSIMKPESGAVTHPALLCELCRRLSQMGITPIVGDSPGGLFNSAYVSAVYAASGVKAVESCGGVLNRDFSHRHVLNPDGFVLKELDYTSYIDKADAIINFCKLKTHGMMGMSACVKNLFGLIPGTFKPEYHYKFPKHEDFALMLIDLNRRFKPVLNIVDAVTGMEGNGPTMGTPRHIGALMASDSPYALDRVCTRIIGLEPDEAETVRMAQLKGLEDEPVIFGDPNLFTVSDYKLVRVRKDIDFDRDLPGFLGLFATNTLKRLLRSIPNAVKSECVGCGKCASVCPAKAITIKNKLPCIDRGKCICCFCCQEFCPKGAMKLKRPLAARLLNR